MEKRVILAIVLVILVLFLYQTFFVPKTNVPPAAEQAAASAPAKTAPLPLKEAVPQPAAPVEAVDFKPVASDKEEKISIDTSLYRAEWSSKGGVLLSWRLKKHKSNKKEDLELVPERAAESGLYPFSFWGEDAEFAQSVNAAFFKMDAGPAILRDGEMGVISFEYSDGEKIKIIKSFSFTGGTYDVGIDIKAWKNGQEIVPGLLWGPGIANRSPAELKKGFSLMTGAAVLSGGKVTRIDEKKYKPEKSGFNFADWAAYEDNYFTALFILPPQKGTAVFIKEVMNEKPLYYLAVHSPQGAFIGPKEYDALKAYGHDAKKVISFGAFGILAEILLIGIKYVHQYIPNWGWSIVIMTLLIKILFFPLTYSSTKSMAKMQELQPKIKALRNKYKKAKQDINQRRMMNEEMMRIYKEHGVNPAGGCLPLLIQLPVFWGVFRMLAMAVEFRHSPFIFWITDLSVKDPYYITPLLMGATQFISTKMTPTSADPSQARMMLIMPVIMTVFFMNFQSGLILYWLTTNVLQIAQQALMNRMMKRKKGENHGKRK
jgi:YidC/Oxa1 family membrane protein insertase